MFRYNESLATSKPLDETGLVDGWREAQLLNSLPSKDRKFKIKMKSGIIVEIDIHFFESFMRALNYSGYIETGVPQDPMESKGHAINIKSVKPMLEYLKNHHESAEYKLPKGSLDLLMLIISKSNIMYEAITDFENTHEELITKLEKRKEEHKIKALEIETQKALKFKTDKMQDQIIEIENYYLDIIEIAREKNNETVAKKMEDEIMPTKIGNVLDEYGTSVLKINENSSRKMKDIKKHIYLTYAFFISEFDLLVAKTGHKTLRLRTIYDIYAAKEPKNALLYIPDYGDKRKIPKF